jgi:hypothetical protein
VAPPGPPEQAADRRPVRVGQECRDKLAIVDARARDIEVMDAILEDANVLRLGLVFDLDVHADRMGYFADPSKPMGLAGSTKSLLRAGSASPREKFGVAGETHRRPQCVRTGQMPWAEA